MVVEGASSERRAKAWTLSVIFLAPSWLYVLYLAYVVPALGPNFSENVFALMNLLAGAFVFVGFVPLAKRWLGQWAWSLLFLAPMVTYMTYVMLLNGD